MSDRGKKIFLGLSVVVPFLLYCVYYYGNMIKNAPYKYSEMESINLKYGLGDNLINTYDSKTGNYQYLDKRDSMVKTNVKLSKDDLLFLHRKAIDMGFWDFPEEIVSPQKDSLNKAPHYYLEYVYKRKSKHMLFDSRYIENPTLADAARQLIEVTTKTINTAEARHKVK